MEVVLTVYDLHSSNRWLRMIGLAAYHTGVEVNGREYSFGADGVVSSATPLYRSAAATISSSTTSITPMLKEKIVMGAFDRGIGDFNGIIAQLRRDFPGTGYDLVRRNCNHFSNEMCKRLLGKETPSWVNRAATLSGRFLSDTTEQDKHTSSVTAPADTSTSKNSKVTTAQTEKERAERKELSGKQKEMLEKMKQRKQRT